MSNLPVTVALTWLNQGLKIPLDNLNSVTVPCAAAGWLKTIETYGSGKVSMKEILEPAIRMAKGGVPEHEINARSVSPGMMSRTDG